MAVYRALRLVGAEGFAYLDDHFASDCPDEKWIPEVGEWGWLAVTRDKKIRAKRRTREVVAQSSSRHRRNTFKAFALSP